MSTLDNQPLTWTSEAVIKRLWEKAAKDQPVSVQVFLTDIVPKSEAEFKSKTNEIIDKIRTELSLGREAVQVGKIYPNARSFSVTSTHPGFFEGLTKCGEVKTILESEQPDILPKPKYSRSVP